MPNDLTQLETHILVDLLREVGSNPDKFSKRRRAQILAEGLRRMQKGTT